MSSVCNPVYLKRQRTLFFTIYFKTLRLKIIRDVELALMEPVKRLTVSYCVNAGAAVASYLFELSFHNILPTSSNMDDVSLAQIRERLSSISATIAGSHEGCSSTCCSCRDLDFGDIKRTVENDVARLTDSGTGLCLDCIKSSSLCQVEGTCRLSY